MPFFVLLLGVMWTLNLSGTFVSPGLLLVLNFSFSTLTSLFVATLLGRTFATRSNPFVLLLGCGVLAWGAASILSVVADPRDINANVTAFNCGSLLAGLCHLSGALLSLRPRRPMRIPAFWVAAAYSVTVGLVALVALLAAENQIPVFFVQGRGGTPLRQVVLGSNILMFVAAGAIVRVAHRRSLSRFIDWFSPALFPMAVGLSGVLVQSSFGGALNWAARAAHYTAGIYILVAAVTSGRDAREWVATLEAALTEATRRYDDLFDLAMDAIVVHEVGTEPMAGRFTNVNQAMCSLLGYSQQEMVRLTPLDITAIEDRGLERHIAAAVLQREGFLRHDEILIAKDGRHVPVEMSSRLFRHSGREMVISVAHDVTERRRTEEERERLIARLDGERALLDLVVNNTAEGVNLVRARDMQYLLINPAYRAMFPGREILGRSVREVWPEVPGLEDFFRGVLDSGKPYHGVEEGFYLRARLEDPPEKRFFNWTLAPLQLPGDGQWAFLNTCSDVTEMVRAREEIAATGEQLSRVLSSITEGYYVLDAEWRVLEMNAAAEAHFRQGNLVGKSIWDVTATPPGAVIRRKYEEAMAAGQPVHFEAESRVQDGRWYDLHLYPREGRLEVYFHDISLRKRALAALEESERRYRGLFESMQEGFLLAEVIADAGGRPVDHRYLELNAACEKVLGRKREEVAGRTHRELFAGSEWESWTALFSPVALTGEPVRVEQQNGSRHYEAFAYRPRPGEFAVLFTDITERKLAEERLRQAQKLESVGLLAGGIAHDFNNLLVGVIGNASLARESLGAGHPAAELLERVQESGEHAAHLTRQMLAYAGKGRFHIERLDLSSMVEEIAGLVQPSISRKILVDFQLHPSLPPVAADRGQIQQVVMNLLLNAAEAIGDTQGAITVTTGVAALDPESRRFDVARPDFRAGLYVCLEVRDTGCGMDDGTRARIFDPFFTTKFTGRGLGLAAVAGIIRGHNGTLEVASAPGTGTCFMAWFPAVSAATAKPSVERVEQAAGTPAATGAVLVVDDEPMVRDMARLVLEHSGFRALVADGGQEALEILGREAAAIGLVLLDLSMPGMNGAETLARLRRIRPGIRVIASSGYSEDEARRRFQGQEIAAFLQKPYTMRRLTAAVRSVLG